MAEMTPHALNHLFMDEMLLCGCGRPETAAELVMQILELCPLYKNRQKFEELLSNDGAQYLILGLMTDANLLEHGGGIGGSWITDKGKMVLESLKKLPDLEVVFDNETIWQGCEKCTPRDGR